MGSVFGRIVSIFNFFKEISNKNNNKTVTQAIAIKNGISIFNIMFFQAVVASKGKSLSFVYFRKRWKLVYSQYFFVNDMVVVVILYIPLFHYFCQIASLHDDMCIVIISVVLITTSHVLGIILKTQHFKFPLKLQVNKIQ